MKTIVYERGQFPVINLDNTDQKFLQVQIKNSLEKYGFLVIENAMIEQSLVDKCYKLSREFFKLDPATKNRYSARNGEQDNINDIGYHHLFSETGVISKKPDIKEFFHVGCELAENKNPDVRCSANKWPREIVGFREAHAALWEKFSNTSIMLLNHLASCFNISQDYMNQLMSFPNSILRTIYYPEIDAVFAEKGAVRAVQHTGINLIGLQCLATASGLEFYTPSKEWVCLKQGEFDDCISVNMGEMMQYLTNAAVQATLHRVVNNQGNMTVKERQAIVFFAHPNLSLKLKPNQSKGDDTELLASDWVFKRLMQIKTPKKYSV